MFPKKQRILQWLSFCLVMSCISSHLVLASEPELVIRYDGNAPPSEQPGDGWERVAVGKALLEEQVEGPPPAWRIADQGNGVLHYRHAPGPEKMAQAAERGWKLSARVRLRKWRMQEYSFAVYIGYVDVERGVRMLMGFNASPDAASVVVFDRGSDRSYEAPEARADEFHLYELVYNAPSRLATLFIDGVEVMSGIKPLKPGSTSIDGVFWGSGDTAGTGDGEFQFIQFEILP